MHENHINALKTFRTAAYEREWATLQDTLATLLAPLERFTALEVVITQIQRYLPTFEGYHPGDGEKGGVVRGLVVAVMSFGFAPDQLPDYIAGEFNTPGSGQFTHGVLEMCRAMQRDREPEEILQFMVSAVANTFLAELSELFYSQHLDLYERVRNNTLDETTGEYSDPEAAQIPIQLWMDKRVEARDITLWLRLADDLEPKLAQLQE